MGLRYQAREPPGCDRGGTLRLAGSGRAEGKARTAARSFGSFGRARAVWGRSGFPSFFLSIVDGRSVRTLTLARVVENASNTSKVTVKHPVELARLKVL